MIDYIYSFQPFFLLMGTMVGFSIIQLTEASIFMYTPTEERN